MKPVIQSQFAYWPLVRMICSRAANNRINHLHERAFRLVYNNNNSKFEELLIKDNSATVHHRNLQLLAMELFKARINLSPVIMGDIFSQRNIAYNLRSQTDFKLDQTRTSHEWSWNL